MQFHTLPSYEAWQLTQPAYERLRNPATSDAERAELRSFIRKVYGFFGPDSSAPRAPRGLQRAGGLGATSGEKVTYYAIVDALSGRGIRRRAAADRARGRRA